MERMCPFCTIEQKREGDDMPEESIEAMRDEALRAALRTDFQRHYEDIVAEYNREKDRVIIEKSFDAA